MRNVYNSDGDTINQTWSQCMGRLVRYHPVTVTVWKQKVHYRAHKIPSL
jgi:hypothetical protein